MEGAHAQKLHQLEATRLLQLLRDVLPSCRHVDHGRTSRCNQTDCLRLFVA